MSKTCAPLQERQEALLKVLNAIGELDPISQIRLLRAAAVFLHIDLDADEASEATE